jgi:hypothetical protein
MTTDVPFVHCRRHLQELPAGGHGHARGGRHIQRSEPRRRAATLSTSVGPNQCGRFQPNGRVAARRYRAVVSVPVPQKSELGHLTTILVACGPTSPVRRLGHRFHPWRGSRQTDHTLCVAYRAATRSARDPPDITRPISGGAAAVAAAKCRSHYEHRLRSGCQPHQSCVSGRSVRIEPVRAAGCDARFVCGRARTTAARLCRIPSGWHSVGTPRAQGSCPSLTIFSSRLARQA